MRAVSWARSPALFGGGSKKKKAKVLVSEVIYGFGKEILLGLELRKLETDATGFGCA